MKVFCHINELGQRGWSSLRTMVVAFDKVVLWAPSFAYLERFRKKDPTLVTADEIIDYLDMGRIQIIGRQWWLYNQDRRKCHKWCAGRAFLDHDEKLLKRVGESVCVVNDYDAKDDAAEWVNNSLSEQQCINVMESAKKDKELVGYWEKIQGKKPRDAAISLFTDAKNHGEAFRVSLANRLVGVPSEPALLSVLESVSSPPKMKTIDFDRKSIDDQMDSAVRVLTNVMERIRTSACTKECVTSETLRDRTLSILNDEHVLTDIREYVRFFDECSRLCSEKMLEEKVLVTITQRLESELAIPLKDYIKPRSVLEGVSNLFELVWTIVWGIYGNPIAFLGLGGLVLHKGYQISQWLGYVPDGFSGRRLPCYIAGVDPNLYNARIQLLKCMKSS